MCLALYFRLRVRSPKSSKNTGHGRKSETFDFVITEKITESQLPLLVCYNEYFLTCRCPSTMGKTCLPCTTSLESRYVPSCGAVGGRKVILG